MMVMIVAVMASNAAPLTPALLTRASHAYMCAQMHRACTELAQSLHAGGEGAVVWSVKDALNKMHAETYARMHTHTLHLWHLIRTHASM